jgi:isoquinoline 1-oxidoreductase beta subunit
VAVVAAHTWAAKQGLAAAAPQWDPGPNGKLTTADIVTQLARAMEKQGAVARHDGDASAAIAAAARKVEASYQQPFLAHAAMEPMNSTVHLTKEGCDIWVGTQIPGITQAVIMKVTGFSREQVRVHNHLLGGGFGRRLEFDGTVRAVQVARQVNGPVQLIYTREEDIQHDMYRPYYYDRVVAGLDANGKLAGWSHRIAGSSIYARTFPVLIKDSVDPDAVESVVNLPYGLSDVHVEWTAQEPPGIPTTWWRGVGVTRGTFVVESFIDELAAAAKQDPLAYRVALLDKNPRAKAVLQMAAQRAGWGKPLPAGEGRGIALCIGFGSFIAQVVQVRVGRMARHADTFGVSSTVVSRSTPTPSAPRWRVGSFSGCRQRSSARSPSRTDASSRRTSVTTEYYASTKRRGSTFIWCGARRRREASASRARPA